MRILLLGSTGLLGQALISEAGARGHEVHGASRTSQERRLDVCDLASLEDLIKDIAPTVIINTVADVSLARCEQEPGRSYQVNSRPSALLSQLSRHLGFHHVYISTDHYYRCNGRLAHSEEASVELLNEYARTKFAGEALALTDPNAWVVRTNIVGFRGVLGQPTFVEWAVDCLERKAPMNLFEDYFTSSIDVTTFSKAFFDLLPSRPKGLLNLASSQVASKKEFLLSLNHHLRFEPGEMTTGRLGDLAGPPRADSCGLDVRRAESLLGWKLPDLETVTQSLAEEYRARSAREVSS